MVEKREKLKMAEGSSASSGAEPITTTKRLEVKKQSLDDAYAAPANLLEIEVADPENHGFGRQRYTDYEIRMRVRTNTSCCCWSLVSHCYDCSECSAVPIK